MVNYKKIIQHTNSQMFNVREQYKDNTLEQNKKICKADRLTFSVGCINITGDLNLGMMIRSASLLGAENFYIFGRNKWDRRSTVGAENYINIVQYVFDDPIGSDERIHKQLLKLARNHSVVLCDNGGFELGKNSHKFYTITPFPNPLFIFGSESHGIPQSIVQSNDFPVVSIPQRGVLRSFNVSAAMNIVVWDYLKEMWL